MAFWSIGHILNKIFDSATSALNMKVTGSLPAFAATPTVDTELPAAAALADAAANPTTPTVGAALKVWNGTTWDNVDGVNTGQLVVTLKSSSGTLINTAQGSSDAVAVNLDALAVFAYLGGFDGTNWARLRTAASNGQFAGTGVLATAMGLHSGTSDYRGMAAAYNIGDAGTAIQVGAVHEVLFNNTNYDRQRGNTVSTPLTSAARTAIAYSAQLTLYNGQGITCTVLPTAKAGATTLSVGVQILHGSTWVTIAEATAFAAAVGIAYVAVFSPDVLDADYLTAVQAKSVRVARDYRVYLDPSDADSVTSSLIVHEHV